MDSAAVDFDELGGLGLDFGGGLLLLFNGFGLLFGGLGEGLLDWGLLGWLGGGGLGL